MKAALYLRVSTPEQEIENQERILLEWANQRDFTITNIYRERESAWKQGHQRELARLKKDAARGKFQLVLVFALDRLTRGGAATILSLVQNLKHYGVKVLSYQETWTDMPGEFAEVLYAIAGWVAKMESQRISERTKAGLARAQAQGKKLGRPVGAKDGKKRKKRRNVG